MNLSVLTTDVIHQWHCSLSRLAFSTYVC